MSDILLKRSPPDDLDWTATIILYIVLIILGIGMCFCLHRANRLIPNRFSFPLMERRGPFDLGSEEEGLLNQYSDVEDDHGAELIDSLNALRISRRYSDDEDEEMDHSDSERVNN